MNSLSTIQLVRCSATQDALSRLASTSFRRASGLIIPATAITVLAWLLCQVGAFKQALGSDIGFFQRTSPRPSRSWYIASQDLLWELCSTWLYGTNRYVPDLWASTYILQGTLLVYTTLLTTVYVSPRFRLLVEVLLYIWSWSSGHGKPQSEIFRMCIVSLYF